MDFFDYLCREGIFLNGRTIVKIHVFGSGTCIIFMDGRSIHTIYIVAPNFSAIVRAQQGILIKFVKLFLLYTRSEEIGHFRRTKIGNTLLIFNSTIPGLIIIECSEADEDIIPILMDRNFSFTQACSRVLDASINCFDGLIRDKGIIVPGSLSHIMSFINGIRFHFIQRVDPQEVSAEQANLIQRVGLLAPYSRQGEIDIFERTRMTPHVNNVAKVRIGYSVFGRVGERIHEGMYLYREMISSGGLTLI
jgi:hypothetical protein